MAYLFPFSLSVLLIASLIPLSLRLGWVDHPGRHKLHQEPTPVIGGLGVAISVFATIPLVGPALPGWPVYVVASLALLAIGALDDWKSLPVLPRIGLQVAVALWMAAQGGAVVESLGTYPYFGELTLGPLALPFTVLVTVGLMNAFNMLDGLDGLLGGVVMAILGVLALAAITGGADGYGQLALMVLAAVAGFYVYNCRCLHRRRAWVFLGDLGSLWLGLTVAYLAIGITHADGGALGKTAVVWVLGLPVLDILATMALRFREGRNPMAPGHEHIHFVLRDNGFSVNGTVGLVTLLAATMGLVGVGLHWLGVNDLWILVGYLVLFVLYTELLQYLMRVARWVAALRWRILGR